MGTRERRAREREETRSRILDAAREMFARDGVEAVTMRAIAQRIEYTPTAIYHHFSDKQALLEELCALDFGTLAQAFRRLAELRDPVQRLAGIGLAYADFALEHPEHYRFMFMTLKPLGARGSADAGHGSPEEGAYAFVRQTVAEGLATGCFRPEFSDPDLLAQLFWSGIHGVVSLPLAKGNDEWIDWCDTRETARAMTAVLLRGTLRDPARVPT